MGKTFEFEGKQLEVLLPANKTFSSPFFEAVYTSLYSRIEDGKLEPHVNIDQLVPSITGVDLYALAVSDGLSPDAPSKKSDIPPDRDCTQIAVQLFLRSYPLFVSFVENCRIKADIAISHAEMLNGEECNISNFIKLKRIANQFNARCWSRQQSTSESQASVSNLGTMSERLINGAFGGLVDGVNLFKVNSDRVQSYGDFVLMCLPNNLWLSVKSGFSRERLLASGYGNDILAVGFFQDFEEFTSRVRIRNMMKAGFLCLYLPDVPVTMDQIEARTSTFEKTAEFYASSEVEWPVNINGRDFIRPLSQISDDLDRLLSVPDISKRLTIDF